MDFTPRDYFNAALLRETDLDHLKNNQNCIVFSLYCAGVAIECMLRAFIKNETQELKSRHNLYSLYQESNLGEKLTEKQKEKFAVDLKEANKMWYNNLRYTSQTKLKRKIIFDIIRNREKSTDLSKILYNYHKSLFDITEDFLKLTKLIGKQNGFN